MIPLPFKLKIGMGRLILEYFSACQSLVNGIATVEAVLQLSLPAPHMYNSVLLSSSVVKSTMIYTRSIYENTEYCPSMHFKPLKLEKVVIRNQSINHSIIFGLLPKITREKTKIQ